jgi:hypothetical protein
MVMLVADRSAMSAWVKAEAGRLTGWTPAVPNAPAGNTGY